MAKKKTVRMKAWPSQYLVLWRTTIDDVPLMLTPDITVAKAYAKSPVTEDDLCRAENAFGIDRCSPVNISLVRFRNGYPYRVDIVRDIEDNEPVIREPRPRSSKR